MRLTSQLIPLAGAVVLGAGGLFVIFHRLRPEFDRATAFLVVALLAGATPLFWSVTRGSVSDVAIFTLVAAAVWAAQHKATTRIAQTLCWVAIVVVPLGATLVVGREPGGILHTLFSSAAGWLSLTPILYVAFIGAIAYGPRNTVAALGAVAAVIIWAAAGAPMAGTLAVLAAGLATVIDWARRRPLAAIAPLVVLALTWNYWLMVQYTVGLLPKDEPVSFAAMVRQQADVHTRAPYVYPFAFPANVWFAWREGVPADRYDVLSTEPRRVSVDLVMDRQADKFLLEGWDAPGSDSLGPAWWIGAHRATIAVPLGLPPGGVNVGVRARARLEEPAVSADLALEINGHEIGRFVASPSEAIEARFTVPAAAVGRVFRAGYNRVTIVSHGVHRVDPSDQRPPGPLGSRGSNRTWPVAIYRLHIAPAS